MITIESTRPDSPDTDLIIRAYLTDVASRWFGRPATPAEVDQALLDEPFDDLTGDTGLFLVAYDDDLPVGCAGARFTAADPDDETETKTVAELTKVFTLPTHRGTGTGSRLIRALEQHCRERGIRTLRLDTRAELAEACALYERLGFTRVAPFNADPYSDRWYAKTLTL
ncbi:GNAT family N-acetyltransferase [Herbiconiux solani]|uniref:GNAT family N-acetyltransferase n=1 Tax=Herbiconiux solani TaxID=661329 RepID=UPI0008269301|nr:GNAT family N-acetyltransferase [Herbiconiux solani]